jgi:hypothetical protein
MEQPNSKFFKLEPFNQGNLLEGIFMYQNNLMDILQQSGKLSSPKDFNISGREDQALIRKLIGYVIEELAEADEKLLAMRGVFETENYTLAKETQDMMGFSKEALEELADAFHFFIEILVFLNINQDDLLAYLKLNPSHEYLVGHDALLSGMNIAHENNIYDEHIRIATFKAYQLPLLAKEQGYYPMSRLSVEVFKEVEQSFWRLTRGLALMQNTLKKKEWRAGNVEPAIEILQERAALTFIRFCELLDILQLDGKAVYSAYENKNLINQERIINNY